jgi:integral membrane sensor domain MASE1
MNTGRAAFSNPGWLVRAALFFGLSAATTLYPMWLGRWLWPHGLSAGLENMFWPASAVHVVGLWRLGLGYWPVVALGTFVAQLLASRPWDSSSVNALGNLAETVLAVWALNRWAGGGQPLARVRGVLVFLAVAAFAPLASSIPGVVTLVTKGWIPAEDYGTAVVVWNAANASSIILLGPTLLLLGRTEWRQWRWSGELIAWLVVGLGCGWLAFDAVFDEGGGVNYAFLIFPFVIYAAVQFGVVHTAASLSLFLVFVYATMIRVAPEMTVERMHDALWFIQSYALVLGACGLLLSALTAEHRAAQEALHQEQARRFESSVREERARLEALRYQINPHFLFNSLNAIRALVPADLKTPRESITCLADYLRSTLYREHNDCIPLSEEIDLIGHYLRIQKIRFGDSLQIAIDVDPAAAGSRVPVLLLQPLVENAIIHGFEQSKGIFQLEIRAHQNTARLEIAITNSGVWRSPSPKSSGGVGLSNVRSRLALLYGDAARLDVASGNGRVTVALHLPCTPVST